MGTVAVGTDSCMSGRTITAPATRQLESRYVTSIVQKAHFVRASRLEGCQAFNEQVELACGTACRFRHDRK